MDNEENNFEELDEVVSSNNGVEHLNSVPSKQNFNKKTNNNLLKTNNSRLNNNSKSQMDYEKNNKKTIEKLKGAKNKNGIPGLNGKEIGNKLAGKSEEEKSGLEKGVDKVGGKATGAAITAATGGVVNGKIADELGDASFQLIKKNYKNQVRIGMIILSAFALLIFIVILALNSDDEDFSESESVNNYVSNNMTDDELYEYLEYMNICPDKSVLGEEIKEVEDIVENDKDDIEGNPENEYDIKAVCDYAITYYKRIKKQNEKFKESCNKAITQPKNVNSPCDVELNIPLLHETMSYNKSYNELWSKKATPNQKKDITDLSNAMVEYVHEYCYVNVGKYKDKDGKIKYGNCEGCTYEGPWYENQEWYYFQISFNKYVSFLKYGLTSTHPYYTGENNKEVILGSTKKNTTINNQNNLYDHECIGPSGNTFVMSNLSTNNLNANI